MEQFRVRDAGPRCERIPRAILLNRANVRGQLWRNCLDLEVCHGAKAELMQCNLLLSSARASWDTAENYFYTKRQCCCCCAWARNILYCKGLCKTTAQMVCFWRIGNLIQGHAWASPHPVALARYNCTNEIGGGSHEQEKQALLWDLCFGFLLFPLVRVYMSQRLLKIRLASELSSYFPNLQPIKVQSVTLRRQRLGQGSHKDASAIIFPLQARCISVSKHFVLNPFWYSFQYECTHLPQV